MILTKPLGTGALLAALMQSECKAAWYQPLLEEMLKANKEAASILAECGVTSCTDVTGFGLTGHLLEMLDASSVSAKIETDRVPIYEGFAEVVALGIRSTLFEDNARVASPRSREQSARLAVRSANIRRADRRRCPRPG